jgi:serine/threonine protein kinase
MAAQPRGSRYVILVIPRLLAGSMVNVATFDLSDPILFSLKISILVSEQSSIWHSKPKSAVGTPAYIAPEVLSCREYDGKVSLCLLTNYTFLLLSPFQDTLLGHSIFIFTLFVLLCKHPFALLSYPDVYMQVGHGKS